MATPIIDKDGEQMEILHTPSGSVNRQYHLEISLALFRKDAYS